MPDLPYHRQPRFTDQLDLAAMPTASSCARLFTKFTLTRWGAAVLLDDATLIVAELVTNAVAATGITIPDPPWSQLTHLNLINLRILGFQSTIVFEVGDVEPKMPTRGAADPYDESGRGLSIVQSLASRWGHYPAGKGKVVWAELPVSNRTSTGQYRQLGSAPRPPTPHGELEPPPEPCPLS
jgi:hypothetical protein